MFSKLKFSVENIILFSLSIIAAINSVLFLWFKTGYEYFYKGINLAVATSPFHYPIYFILIVLILGTLAYFSKKFNWLNFITKIIIATFPTEIVFLWILSSVDPHYTPLHWIFHIIPTVWIYILFFLVLYKLGKIFKIKLSFFEKKINFKGWLKKQGKVYLTALGIVMTLSFSFGLYNIQKAAIVDEALWTFDKIPSFWKNIEECDWYGTRVSDKPGLTVAAISGLGILEIANPAKYDSNDINPEKIEKLNFAFRFPILAFVILMLPVLYFSLKKLLDKKSAILSVTFIGLSPILIGVTRMLNPDALLWVFTTLSLIAFLTFLEKKKDSALIWSGIFLGFSLLTKYVSNFLYIFFLGTIFLKYIFSKSAKKNSNLFFKKNLFSYMVLVFISFLTFFIAYPATWIKPDRIFLGTIFSQAFEPIFPYFIAILLISLIDTFFLKNIILKNILDFISNQKQKLAWLASGIFLFFLGIIFWNAYTGSSLFDLAAILSSPKSSYRDTNSLWFMATNFYPLIFGISPIALFLIIYFLIKSFGQKIKNTLRFRVSFYLIIFILLYYIGSVFSNVSATIRYQIILYPLVFIISGIWLNFLTKKFKEKKYWPEISIFLLILILSSVLFCIKPFYFSYASILLPQKYHIDYKDMGLGSYEAAMYLNSLPNAEEIDIWTDKNGVCTFFVGKCYAEFDKNILREREFDYYVVSSGRKSLSTNKIKTLLGRGYNETPRIDNLYLSKGSVITIELANRPNNYIKIFKKDTFEK